LIGIKYEDEVSVTLTEEKMLGGQVKNFLVRLGDYGTGESIGVLQHPCKVARYAVPHLPVPIAVISKPRRPPTLI
jgi:hypothetical protein